MSSSPGQTVSKFPQTADLVASIARSFHVRGWLLGTSGNLSAVVKRSPLELAMTASGVDKGELNTGQILLVDEHARVVGHPSQQLKPSDESLLHLKIVKARGAGAVFHTHSVWNTVISDLYASDGGLTIEGYEMLKGLAGVNTHEHREWLPIIENSQDMPALAETVGRVLEEHQDAHGFLLRRHGLYSWGKDVPQAKRHIEILEFLLETLGRRLEVARAREEV